MFSGTKRKKSIQYTRICSRLKQRRKGTSASTSMNSSSDSSSPNSSPPQPSPPIEKPEDESDFELEEEKPVKPPPLKRARLTQSGSSSDEGSSAKSPIKQQPSPVAVVSKINALFDEMKKTVQDAEKRIGQPVSSRGDSGKIFYRWTSLGKVKYVAPRWAWLSNMAPYPVEIDDVEYPTVEHYLQVQKWIYARASPLKNVNYKNDPVITAILSTADPIKAKKLMGKAGSLGKQLPYNQASWDLLLPSFLETAFTAKVDLHPGIRRLLLETGDRDIVERKLSHKKKTPPTSEDVAGMMVLWKGKWYGDNAWGKLWMKIRSDIKKSGTEVLPTPRKTFSSTATPTKRPPAKPLSPVQKQVTTSTRKQPVARQLLNPRPGVKSIFVSRQDKEDALAKLRASLGEIKQESGPTSSLLNSKKWDGWLEAASGQTWSSSWGDAATSASMDIAQTGPTLASNLSVSPPDALGSSLSTALVAMDSIITDTSLLDTPEDLLMLGGSEMNQHVSYLPVAMMGEFADVMGAMLDMPDATDAKMTKSTKKIVSSKSSAQVLDQESDDETSDSDDDDSDSDSASD